MLPEENAAPGQQNFPDKNGDNGRETQTSAEIISGANEEDQIDAVKEQASDNPSTNDEGAAPTAYQYERKNSLSQSDINEGIKTFEDTSAPHAALETPEGKNNGAKPAAFDGQRSNHP